MGKCLGLGKVNEEERLEPVYIPNLGRQIAWAIRQRKTAGVDTTGNEQGIWKRKRKNEAMVQREIGKRETGIHVYCQLDGGAKRQIRQVSKMDIVGQVGIRLGLFISYSLPGW